MTLRTLTRTSAAGAVVSVLVASFLTFVAPSANALTKEGITITKDEVVKRSYSPIPANNPANSAHTPDVCATSSYCDVVPLEVIVPPSVGPEDEYFIQVEMFWESGRTPSDPVLYPDGYTTNDLDMFLYTDPATAEEAETRGHAANSESDPYITSGATGDAPERVLSFKPDGAYQIVIVNFVGANQGYDLEATWFSESIPTPFEKLAEEFSPSTTTTSTTTTTTSTTTTAPPPETTAPPPTLETATVHDDADFDPTEFDSDFEDELAAPEPIDVDPVVESTQAPSGLALFFWLLAVPLGIVAAGGTVLLRRRATL